MKLLKNVFILLLVISLICMSMISCDLLKELTETDLDGKNDNTEPDDKDNKEDGDEPSDEDNNTDICEHNIGKWYFAGGESCENGTYFGFCLTCKETVHRESDASDQHDWDTASTVLPSCEEGGYDVRICSICEKNEKFNFTNKRGHSISVKVVEPTCTTDGYVIITCNVCDYEEKMNGESASHLYTNEYLVGENGHYKKCSRCGEETEQEAHKLDSHDCCSVCKYSKNPLAGTYDITMWVSELTGVKEQFLAQIDKFEAANPGIVINATVEGFTEADAASLITADVASAPDIYCFPQDQLARLIQASALAAPGGDIAELIKSTNGKGSVDAATSDGTLYAYPMTADNGYYMYYDTSVITDPDSLEQIIADCEAAGKSFGFELDGNAWYTASFFFGAGCSSVWEVSEDGETFLSVADDFNSDKGLVAMKGMAKLTNSGCWVNTSSDFTNCAAIVTGIWNSTAATNHFGENLGATDLPSFTVDGNSYHLGSFTGYKLMGVKPQADSKKGAVLSLLATYLTNAECQSERFAQFQWWAPSNLVAQASDAVQANISLAALALQSNYGHPQGQIHGDWWSIAGLLGTESHGETAPTADELQASLTKYANSIADLVVVKEVHTWGVIGEFLDSGWNKDYVMTESPEGTWTSPVLALEAGNQIKVRKDGSWATDYGQVTGGVTWEAGHSEAGVKGGKNIVIAESGNYYVVLVFEDEIATITLVAAE